jgi:hypothetical protein
LGDDEGRRNDGIMKASSVDNAAGTAILNKRTLERVQLSESQKPQKKNNQH